MAHMKLDTLLKKYKINQTQITEDTGINKNTISKYCNNTFEKIDKNHIDLLCKYFQCTPNDLIQINDNVDINPAKILFYDENTDGFFYDSIKNNYKNNIDNYKGFLQQEFKKQMEQEFEDKYKNIIEEKINKYIYDNFFKKILDELNKKE